MITPWSSRWWTTAGSPRRQPHTHPQRSLLLRALQGRTEAEPDLSVREARVGDRYLLCSDGLSDVVTEQTLHKTLVTIADPDDAVDQLIELAIRSGGPDNITCIVADVIDTAAGPGAASQASVIAGAASTSDGPGAAAVRPRHSARRGRPPTSVTQVGRVTTPRPDRHGRDRRPGRPRRRPAGHDDRPGRAGPTTRTRRPVGAAARWPVVTSILVVLRPADRRRRLCGLALHPEPVLRRLGRRQRWSSSAASTRGRRDEPVQRAPADGYPDVARDRPATCGRSRPRSPAAGLAGAKQIVVNIRRDYSCQ